jgi:hypothetical protein
MSERGNRVRRRDDVFSRRYDADVSDEAVAGELLERLKALREMDRKFSERLAAALRSGGETAKGCLGRIKSPSIVP